MPQKLQVRSKGIRYLSFNNFSTEDSASLRRRFRFHELDLEDCLSLQERPKIDEYDKYIFIVLQLPLYDSKNNAVETSEVNIFIGQTYLIINHNNDLDALKEIEKAIQTTRGRKEYMSNGTGYFLYKIIEDLFNSSFRVLDRLQRDIRTLEKEVFRTREQRDWLEDILELKKSIITFRRTILPQRSVISQLEHKNKKFLRENLEIYFDNIVDAIEKIWQQLEIMKETVDTLQATNESLLTHYTNHTMKVLTIISVIMLPLTFITGLYGMNINLPLQNNEQAFFSIVGGMILLIFFMIIIFRLKRWM